MQGIRKETGRFRGRSLAAAASAVGASLAAGQSANASIIYSGPVGQTLAIQNPGTNSGTLDFDSTPPAEVRFLGSSPPNSKSVQFLHVDTWKNGFAPEGKQDKSGSFYDVVALNDGAVIGPLSSFVPATAGSAILYQSTPTLVGTWSAGRIAYMGFEFATPTDKQTHYGWVGVSISPDSTTATIGPWAWESTPDTPIVAGTTPEPSSAVLTVGSLAALLVRRRTSGREDAPAGR